MAKFRSPKWTRYVNLRLNGNKRCALLSLWAFPLTILGNKISAVRVLAVERGREDGGGRDREMKLMFMVPGFPAILSPT
jgi:hypothetical protein